MARGNRASALLQDELLNEAFDRLEAEYFKGWKDSKPDDEKGRERAFVAISLLNGLRGHLRRVMETGHLAQQDLEYIVKTRKK